MRFVDKNSGGILALHFNNPDLIGKGMLRGKTEPFNTLIFNKGEEQTVEVDEIPYKMPKNAILPLVANETFTFEKPHEVFAWQFNREFYCIVDHDAEVGCVGFLFYGIEHPFFVQLEQNDVDIILRLHELFLNDMRDKDELQGEMLRTVLKRLIIHITRMAKKQSENYKSFSNEKMDIIRNFNVLLEGHYQQEKEVKFYAMAMNKSPKTLANIFAMCNYPSPSKLIKKRVIREAKRYALYTDKSAKEVAYLLGFDDAAHFSHYFKTNVGVSFSAFKQENALTS